MLYLVYHKKIKYFYQIVIKFLGPPYAEGGGRGGALRINIIQ